MRGNSMFSLCYVFTHRSEKHTHALAQTGPIATHGEMLLSAVPRAVGGSGACSRPPSAVLSSYQSPINWCAVKAECCFLPLVARASRWWRCTETVYIFKGKRWCLEHTLRWFFYKYCKTSINSQVPNSRLPHLLAWCGNTLWHIKAFLNLTPDLVFIEILWM